MAPNMFNFTHVAPALYRSVPVSCISGGMFPILPTRALTSSGSIAAYADFHFNRIHQLSTCYNFQHRRTCSVIEGFVEIIRP